MFFLIGVSVYKKKRRFKYVIYFNIVDLYFIRRLDFKLIWFYVVFILKDGNILLVFYFYFGGISEMIRRL